MNLLELRNRIRDKAIDNGLTYTEIETLFDVNLLLEQTMPCLMWRYSGETNNFDEVGTEMNLNVYLITTFPDSVRVETDTYQRDYIVTQQNALRTYFYTWLQAMPFESGDDYLEILSTEEIPIAERLGINEFLTVDFRVNISIKRDFCVDPEQVTPSPSQVQVYFNDVLRYTQACNVDLELILKNQDGDLINDATFTGYEIVVTQAGADARVSNSDDSYDVNVASGGDLELPDITVSNSDDSYSVTYPSVQDVELPDETINIVDEDGNPLDSITFPVYTDPNIDISTYCPPPVGAMPLKTGQTISYATGDDGDIEAGRDVNFFTLSALNPFGNTNRFTDELGLQTYANDIVIDWSTFDNSLGNVLGYYRIDGGGSWATALTTASGYNIASFTNWRLTNIRELLNIAVYEGNTNNQPLRYAPLNLTSGTFFWSSTTNPATTTSAMTMANTAAASVSQTSKTLTFPRFIACRTFTVTGTTLT